MILPLLALAGWFPLQTDSKATPGETTQARSLGHYESTFEDFDRPSAVAYGPNGWLWISDADSRRLVAYDPEGNLVVAVAWSRYSLPSGLAIGPQGHVWVSDAWNRKVFEVDTEGRVLSAVGTDAAGKPELLRPAGICFRGETLWVADRGLGRLCGYTRGEPLRTLGEGILLEPRDVCLDDEGNLAVVDSGLAGVFVFDSEGTLVRRFGEWGWFPGLFADPSGIDFHGGRFYVADRENQRIQVLERDGTPLYRIGTHAIVPREGEGKLHYPSGLALAPNGERLAIVEPLDGRVQVFGMGPGEKPPIDPTRPEGNQPSPHYGERWALARTYLAILEPESHRIRLFDLRFAPEQDPALISEIGSFGSALGQFRDPHGLWLDPKDLRLLVADTGNARIVEVQWDLDPSQPMAQTTRAARFVRSFDLDAWNASLEPNERLEGPLRPEDIVQSEAGVRFVLLAQNRTVLVFDRDWKAIARITPSADHPLLAPVAIAFCQATQEVAVADEAIGQVQTYAIDGTWKRTLGLEELRRPRGLEYQADGTLLVVDRWQAELFTFSPDGSLVSRQYHPGLGRAGLFGPTDVAVDAHARRWILDHGNHRGMVFDAQGNWITAFGSKLYTRPARRPEATSAEETSK